MDTAQKQRITRKFLQRHSLDRDVLIDDEVLKAYRAIGDGLDEIEAIAPQLFDTATIEDDPEQLSVLFDILDRAITFESGSPPALIDVDSEIIHNRVKFCQLHQDLSQLPGCDYYHRQVETVVDSSLSELIMLSREKLKTILLDALPELESTNQTAIDKIIYSTQSQKRKACKVFQLFQTKHLLKIIIMILCLLVLFRLFNIFLIIFIFESISKIKNN